VRVSRHTVKDAEEIEGYSPRPVVRESAVNGDSNIMPVLFDSPDAVYDYLISAKSRMRLKDSSAR